MGTEVWLVLLCDGFRGLSIRVTWQPVTGPSRIWGVPLVESNIQLQDRRPTMSAQHWVEGRLAG